MALGQTECQVLASGPQFVEPWTTIVSTCLRPLARLVPATLVCRLRCWGKTMLAQRLSSTSLGGVIRCSSSRAHARASWQFAPDGAISIRAVDVRRCARQSPLKVTVKLIASALAMRAVGWERKSSRTQASLGWRCGTVKQLLHGSLTDDAPTAPERTCGSMAAAKTREALFVRAIPRTLRRLE